MPKNIHCLAAIISFLFSCSSDSAEKTEPNNSVHFVHSTEEDTMPAPKLSGIYYGVFPENISHTILFKDNQFKHEQQKFNEEATFRKSLGNFTTTSNKVFLTQTEEKDFNIVFKRVEDTLYGVLINGVKPRDSTKYSLMKQPLASENEHWKKEAEKGVVFVGLGNEPFWNVKIFDNKAVFNFAAGGKESTVSYVRDQRNDTTVYKFSNDDAKTLLVIPQFCSDGMSDYIYEYKVKLNYNTGKYNGCGILLRGKLNDED